MDVTAKRTQLLQRGEPDHQLVTVHPQLGHVRHPPLINPHSSRPHFQQVCQASDRLQDRVRGVPIGKSRGGSVLPSGGGLAFRGPRRIDTTYAGRRTDHLQSDRSPDRLWDGFYYSGGLGPLTSPFPLGAEYVDVHVPALAPRYVIAINVQFHRAPIPHHGQVACGQYVDARGRDETLVDELTRGETPEIFGFAPNGAGR